MRLVFWIADKIAESDAFFIAVVIIVLTILLAIGGFVFWTIIKWIEMKW